ncbi:Type II restriction-modification system restriction subunit [Lachnospiraceae bacterium TWA4]|nr:Type II restriction-modification system restriction subunit [Lachnospiraceae bacterium TWA4]
MFIWATMNSADQGVFPMDTAFKRRWNFTYLGIDDNDEKLQGKYVILADDYSQKVEWNKLRKAINNFLAKYKINEDKQLGPYFISKNIIIPSEGDEIDRDKFIDTFKNKVIMYLFEDAARQKKDKLFEGCFESKSRYSEICKEFEEKGIGIFNHDILLECDVEDIGQATKNSDK